MASHKEFLERYKVFVDDSHLTDVNHWRALYEGEGPGSYEQRVIVSKSDGSGALAASGKVDKSQRKKSSYKAHIKACKKWAAMIFNEQTELKASETLAESAAAAELEFLQGHYESAGVWPMLEENFPEVFGMGTVAVATEYSPEFGIVHKWHSAENILPIETSQGRIRSVVFISEFPWTDGQTYTLYNIHEEQRQKRTQAGGLEGVAAVPGGGSSYRVRNIVSDGGGVEIPVEQFGITGEFESPVRLFSVFKPFNRKKHGFNNAFGCPIYFDDEDMITEIDDLYDIKNVDAQTSRRNIFIDKDVLVCDDQGRANIPQHLFGVIVSTQGMENRGGELKSHFITEFAPEPHMEKYSIELQSAVNRFSDAVGLGSNAFKIEHGQKATATQVVSEEQEKYTNLKKHLSILSFEFAAFNAAILSVAKDNQIAPALDPAKPIGFFVQDSVVIDDETRKEEARQEVGAGLRSVKSYLEEFRGLSGKELEEELALLQESSDMDDLVARLKQGDGEEGDVESEEDNETGKEEEEAA